MLFPYCLTFFRKVLVVRRRAHVFGSYDFVLAPSDPYSDSSVFFRKSGSEIRFRTRNYISENLQFSQKPSIRPKCSISSDELVENLEFWNRLKAAQEFVDIVAKSVIFQGSQMNTVDYPG